jgi:lipopolysaccharide assembly outer membrane protein LptD (OstA)
MRMLTLLTLCVISLTAIAQESKSVTIEGEHKERITCQQATFHKENNTVTLLENVKITSDRLYLEADSVIYDMSNKSFVAYQYKELKFKGEVILTERPKNIVRYKLKSDKLYIE